MFSVMISVIKRSFLNEESEPYLSVGRRTNILNVAKGYSGLVKWLL